MGHSGRSVDTLKPQYNKWLLEFEKVELELQKAKRIKELEEGRK